MKKYSKIGNYANRHHAQAGMTLIELTVVLLILIGLAGLMIPYVSGFAEKTHDSTNASNLAALNTNLQRFRTEKNVLPDRLETLINKGVATAGTASGVCTTATAGTVYCGMLDPELFAVTTLNFVNGTSLAMAGMQTAYSNNPDTANKTFQSNDGTVVNIGAFDGSTVGALVASVGCGRDAAAAPVVGAACTPSTYVGTVKTSGLKDAHLASALGGAAADYDTACYDYVTLGVGDNSELIGRTMSAAPIHFATNGDQSPINNYNHYVAIFKVDKSNTAPCTTATEAAKFVGAAMGVPVFPNNKLFGQAAGTSFAYENQAAQ